MAAVALSCWSSGALGFVPYRTAGGQAFFWPRTCVAMRVYVDDLPDMTPDEIMTAARGAAAAWSAPANPCSFMNVVVERASGPGPQVAYDNVNTSRSGEIRDSDIEVNAKNFLWGDVLLVPGNAKMDLQNVLTHEMGHLLGFDHTCFIPGIPGGPPLDDAGKPIPACDMASQAVQATTMFASQLPGDIAKRTLEPDDQRAICQTYPVADAGAPGD